MALLKGDDKILYLYISSVWVPIGCVTDHSFSETVDLLELSIDEWVASVPTNQGYEIAFTGIQIVSISGTHSYDAIKLIKRAKTLIQWKIQSAVDQSEQGYGFITSISESAPAGDLLTFEGSILGFGLYTNKKQLSGTSNGSSSVSEGQDLAALWQDGVDIIFQDGTAMVF